MPTVEVKVVGESILPGEMEKKAGEVVNPAPGEATKTGPVMGGDTTLREKTEKLVGDKVQEEVELPDDQITVDLSSHREGPSSEDEPEPASTSEGYPILTMDQRNEQEREDAKKRNLKNQQGRIRKRETSRGRARKSAREELEVIDEKEQKRNTEEQRVGIPL